MASDQQHELHSNVISRFPLHYCKSLHLKCMHSAASCMYLGHRTLVSLTQLIVKGEMARPKRREKSKRNEYTAREWLHHEKCTLWSRRHRGPCRLNRIEVYARSWIRVFQYMWNRSMEKKEVISTSQVSRSSSMVARQVPCMYISISNCVALLFRLTFTACIF